MHNPADNWTRVTAVTHPQIHTGFNVISRTDNVAYNVPPEYSYGLGQVELVLGQLDEPTRTKLYQGEFDDPVLVAAANMFAAFLYGWPSLFTFTKKRRFR